MSEKYDDAELQRSLNKWYQEHEDEVRAEDKFPEEFKLTMSEGYKDYHERLKNGFVLIFTQFPEVLKHSGGDV